MISLIFAFIFYSSVTENPYEYLEVKITAFSCNVNSDQIKIMTEDLMTNEIQTIKGKIVKEIHADSPAKNGKYFVFKFPLNHKFKAVISDVDCENKTIYFDTNTPSGTEYTSITYTKELNLLLSYPKGISNDKDTIVKSGVLFKYTKEDGGFFSYFNDTILVGDIYYNLGVLKTNKEDYTGAINDFTKALEFNSSDFDAYYNRCVTKIKSNDISGACKDLQLIKNETKYDVAKLTQKYCQ